MPPRNTLAKISLPGRSPPVTASLGFGILPRPRCDRDRRGAPPCQAQPNARILLIDKDRESRRMLHSRFTAAGYALESAGSARAALESCARARSNLAIMDLRLDDLGGLALLMEIKRRWPALPVLIVTAHGTISEAVQATQHGASAFLVKPVGNAELLSHVERALAASSFTQAAGDWRAQIVSRSRLMEERLAIANRAAASEEPVLLTGQNGTGKELLARVIHAASSRRQKPFVAVRCRDMDEAALELELFGRGASTLHGAHDGRAGALQAAAGGTLWLDEIDHLPARLQLALLTWLRRPATRAQSQGPVRPDVRLIGTTSRDLKTLMQAGAFRQDLYYQISVLPIEIPPLGRRREDIPLLVSHFLQQATASAADKKKYTRDAIALLASADWPGNVRQLSELVRQNVALSHDRIMTREFVERSLAQDTKSLPTYGEARAAFARDYLIDALRSTDGNVTRSARLAQCGRTHFYALMARHRIEPNDFKSAGEL